MTLGNISVKVVLDCPLRIHYGSQGAITGHVSLTFASHGHDSSASSKDKPPGIDLFGPLRLQLEFRGHLRIRVPEESESQPGLKEDHTLYSITKTIFDAPFHTTPGEDVKVPFDLHFPERFPHRQQVSGYIDDSGKWRSFTTEQQQEANAGDALPPSLQVPIVCGKHVGGVSVEYKVLPFASMPGIDVKWHFAQRNGTPVLYDRPRVPQALPSGNLYEFRERMTIQSSRLRSFRDQQHRGLRDKAKGFFKHADTPSYTFVVSCTGIPQALSSDRHRNSRSL
jgi:hypothetical protein